MARQAFVLRLLERHEQRLWSPVAAVISGDEASFLFRKGLEQADPFHQPCQRCEDKNGGAGEDANEPRVCHFSAHPEILDHTVYRGIFGQIGNLDRGIRQ